MGIGEVNNRVPTPGKLSAYLRFAGARGAGDATTS